MAKKNVKKISKKGLVVMSAMLVLLCWLFASVALIIKVSNDNKKYMGIYPYLLQMRVIEICKDKMYATGEWYYCRVDDYGVSEKGDVFAEYNIQQVDKETGERVGGIEKRRLFFKQDEASKDNIDGSWGVTEY